MLLPTLSGGCSGSLVCRPSVLLVLVIFQHFPLVHHRLSEGEMCIISSLVPTCCVLELVLPLTPSWGFFTAGNMSIYPLGSLYFRALFYPNSCTLVKTVPLQLLEVKLLFCIHLASATRWHFRDIAGNWLDWIYVLKFLLMSNVGILKRVYWMCNSINFEKMNNTHM